MANTYTAQWFDIFLRSFPDGQTEREAAFLARQLPNPPYRTVVDLCCGFGRHAQALAAYGYTMIGVDRDAAALAEARRRSPPNVTYVEQDMRRFDELPVQADAVICMWQSFGYFDDATNADILAQISRRLPPHGRLILDVNNRAFFEQLPPTRTIERNGATMIERTTWQGVRARVTLRYEGTDTIDTFDWQLYTPEELCVLASAYQLRPLVQCANYDEAQPPLPSLSRMQIVFEKAA